MRRLARKFDTDAAQSRRVAVAATQLYGQLHAAQRQPQDETARLQRKLDWADSYPQSVHLLREEAQAWNKTPWPLQLQGF